MTEHDHIEPGEIDAEGLRTQLADMGMPLTSNIVNCDNAWLEPIEGLIGHVSEVNGEDAQELPGFVPTRHELFVLVKYWMTQIIDYDFWFFSYQQTDSSDSRRSAFGGRRIERMKGFIDHDAVERAVDEAYREYGGEQKSEAWRIFLHGTDEERRAFRAECDAAEVAIAREHEDQFYATLLRFLAGEPHDIQQGTVGMAWAEIAKKLVNENPALAAPENKEMLLKEIYDREMSGHSVGLNASEIAMIEELVDRRNEPGSDHPRDE